VGDRANVYFKDECNAGQGVYLYTHNRGSDLPIVVQTALKRGRNRWDDSQYLSRIIFCEMVKDDIMGKTGYGLSTTIGDNTIGRPIIVVDCRKSLVGLSKEGEERGDPQIVWTFDEYSKLDEIQINEHYLNSH